mgnify:CR=1 FL=1
MSRKTEKRDDLNDVQLSAHFILREFESPDTRTVKIRRALIDRLNRLAAIINSPIIIHSGYRTPEHNREVGGARSSQHLNGAAADISSPRLKVEQLAGKCKEAGFSYIKVYPGHVHVDVRD